MAKWSAKDPSDVRDYWVDWTAFLPADEDISDATVTVAAGLTKVADDFTDKQVRVRVSAGTAGESYEITCLITTSAGQQFETTRTLQVKERTS